MTPDIEERLRDYVFKVMARTAPRRWSLMSDDQQEAIRREFDELPFPPLNRVLMQRRLMQLYAGKRSHARIPTEARPDDVRILARQIMEFRPLIWSIRHRPPTLEARPGESPHDLYRRDLTHMHLYLAFVLVAEETMPRSQRAAVTSPAVIAAKVAAYLATASLDAGERMTAKQATLVPGSNKREIRARWLAACRT
jgi:hypothetical protein